MGDWLLSFLTPVFSWFQNLFAKFYARVALAGVLVTKALDWVKDLINEIFGGIYAQIDALHSQGMTAIGQLQSGIGSISGQAAGLEFVGVINAVVPVQEALQLFAALFLLWAAKIILRWIKSFVPTIAN